MIEAIGRFDSAEVLSRDMRLREVRSVARDWFQDDRLLSDAHDELEPTLMGVQVAVARIGQAYLARTTHGLPLLLVPKSPETVERVGQADGAQLMSVHYSRDEGWLIRAQTHAGPAEFAFDLPKELLHVFDREGRLRPKVALDTKTQHLEEIHAYRMENGQIQTMVLKLDQSWVQSAREALRRPRNHPEP